jgi:hypothetical protein
MTFTQDYSARIDAAVSALVESDHILIGAGAGLSAAAGLNYQDLKVFNAWYPQFAELGYRNIWDAIVHHWSPDDANRRQFWAFWATHIQRIRYDVGPAHVLGALTAIDEDQHAGIPLAEVASALELDLLAAMESHSGALGAAFFAVGGHD